MLICSMMVLSLLAAIFLQGVLSLWHRWNGCQGCKIIWNFWRNLQVVITRRNWKCNRTRRLKIISISILKKMAAWWIDSIWIVHRPPIHGIRCCSSLCNGSHCWWSPKCFGGRSVKDLLIWCRKAGKRSEMRRKRKGLLWLCLTEAVMRIWRMISLLVLWLRQIDIVLIFSLLWTLVLWRFHVWSISGVQWRCCCCFGVGWRCC